MPHSLDCVFYIERAPDITFRNGVFHVTYEVGKDTQIEVVLAPNIYLATRRRGDKAVAAFEARGTIVDMRASH